jgi:hypothetical protein
MSETPKIAILFAGEYRTFPICRGTMKFLDQEGIDSDIYFSTWNITNTDSGIKEVSELEIQTVMNRPVVVKINDPSKFSQSPNFIKQIHQRKFAVELVKNSGKKYDYVFLVRPDTFFENNSFFKVDEFPVYNDFFGAQSVPSNGTGLSDNIMFSNYDNIVKIIDGITPEEAGGPNHIGGWHGYFQRYVEDRCSLKINTIPIGGNCNIGRFGISKDSTFEQVTVLYFESMGWFQTS